MVAVLKVYEYYEDYLIAMAGSILFFVGLLLSGALVWRALAGRWWRAYPVVFAYFLLTFAHGVSGWLIYAHMPSFYATFRWVMEALYVAFGFGLIRQVYAAVPQQYPGVVQIIKMIAQRIAALAPLFLALALFLSRREPLTLDTLERNFRLVQAILIVTVFGLVTYYGIPLSRNLQALLRGYGFYLAVFIVRYTLWPLQYGGLWQFVMPVAYMTAQIIWLTGLWRYEKPPSDEALLEQSAGFETRAQIVRLRKQLQTPFVRE